MDIAHQFDQIDLASALKKNLGDASIYDRLFPLLEEIKSRFSTMVSVADKIDSRTFQSAIDALVQLNQSLAAIDAQTPEQFVPVREAHVTQIVGIVDAFRQAAIPFLVLAQENLLQESIRGASSESAEAARSYLKDTSDKIIADLKLQSEDIIANARKQASEIQNTARDTAVGVSLISAQEQFEDLLSQFRRGMAIFGTLAGFGFVIFTGYVVILINREISINSMPAAVYSAAVRVTFLAAIAAWVSFSLKIFRANIHMYYHTLHRQQLTNSIQTFVDAARTDEQRDAILLKLVEIVSSFGQSGLVGNSDDMPNTAKVIVESLPKALAGAKAG